MPLLENAPAPYVEWEGASALALMADQENIGAYSALYSIRIGEQEKGAGTTVKLSYSLLPEAEKSLAQNGIRSYLEAMWDEEWENLVTHSLFLNSSYTVYNIENTPTEVWVAEYTDATRIRYIWQDYLILLQISSDQDAKSITERITHHDPSF